jgi:hypothetical protein
MTNSLVLDFVTKFAVVGNSSQLVLPVRLGQTKRTYVGLWCEDDGDTLGLGILIPFADGGRGRFRHAPWSGQKSGMEFV